MPESERSVDCSALSGPSSIASTRAASSRACAAR